MNKSIIAFFSLLGCIFVVNTPVLCAADNLERDKKVVLVIADYLDISDIKSMGFMRKLASVSSSGLMSNRQPGKAGAERSKLIIGSGKKLEMDKKMAAGGSADSMLEQYRLISGRNPTAGSLVYTDINRLKLRNKGSEYINYIGYLGEAVNIKNGKTCFLGNSDRDEIDRSSMVMVMDHSGSIDLGETESLLTEDALFPYGKRTDYKRLAELYKQYLPASSFMVVETGDMARLEYFRDQMCEEAYLACREAAMGRIDSFMEGLVSKGGFDTLIFISTYPSSREAEKNNRLTPVIVFGSGGNGLLYSENTRREGIIANSDLSAFIEWKLGYSKSSAIKEIKRENPLSRLEIMNEEAVRVSRLRTPVLTAYAIFAMTVMLLLFAAVLYRGTQRISISKGCCVASYSMLVFPLVYLYMPVSLTEDSPAAYLLVSSAFALSISFLVQMLFKDRVKGMFIICLLLLAGLSMDILSGSPFIKKSVLGYDPIIGARFYGIGNEYTGMYIGSSLAAYGSLQDHNGRPYSKAVSIIFYAVCTLSLGLSFLGANFGGALAAAAGYLLAYYVQYGIKFSKRNVFLGILLIIAAAGFFILSDSLGIGSSSHMGSLVSDAGQNGLGVISSTIGRKVSMNIRLMRYTIWTKVLIIIIAIIAVMLYRPAKLLKRIFESRLYLKCSWIGITGAAMAGFALNDSGIVMASTAMIYMIFTLLLICIGEREETDGIQKAGEH